MKNALRRDETRMDQPSTAVDDLYSDASPPTFFTPLPDKAKTGETAVPTSRRLWALFDRMRNREHDPYRHLLMLRFVLLNLAAFALLGVAYVHGFVDMVVAAEARQCVATVASDDEFGVIGAGQEINELAPDNLRKDRNLKGAGRSITVLIRNT